MRMDSVSGEAYVSPPPLPPQAHLSAAFQAAAAAGNVVVSSPNSIGQFQEALMSRMGRSFGLTGGELKDFQNTPFSAASLSLASAAVASRGGADGFVGFPFLSHMTGGGQPPFLHHFVDPRFSSAAAAAASAFRPFLSSTASGMPPSGSSVVDSTCGKLGKNFSSAFQPPSKTGASPPTTLFSPGQNLYPRSSAGSPGSPSSSPSSHRRMDENSNNTGKTNPDRHDSVSPISMDSSHHDDIMESCTKKPRLGGPNDMGCCCPICGMPLHPSELEAHYSKELDYLTKLSEGLLSSGRKGPSGGHHHPLGHPGTMLHQGFKSPPHQMMESHMKQMSPKNPLEVAPRSRWDTFQRIQRNRQSRIRVKLSRRAGKRPEEVLEEESQEIEAMRQEMRQQKIQLLEKQKQQKAQLMALEKGNPHEDEDIDIVGDKANCNNSVSEEGSELQLQVYGPVQFTEADVLACMNAINGSSSPGCSDDGAGIDNEHDDGDDDARSGEKAQQQQQPCGSAKGDGAHTRSEASDLGGRDKPDELEASSKDREEGSLAPQKGVDDVESLRAKLKELEEQHKCSKCTKILQKPVVNVTCWHIKCEHCWLTSLGTSKSCSLCGVSSSPSDLRRVFL